MLREYLMFGSIIWNISEELLFISVPFYTVKSITFHIKSKEIWQLRCLNLSGLHTCTPELPHHQPIYDLGLLVPTI